MPPARIVEDHSFESLVMEYVKYVVQISFKDAKEFYIIVRDRCFQKKSVHTFASACLYSAAGQKFLPLSRKLSKRRFRRNMRNGQSRPATDGL